MAAKKAARKKRASPRKPDPRPKDKQGGRPSMYTRELALEICEGLSDGHSLLKMSKERDHFPVPHVVRRWVLGIGGPQGEELEWFRLNYNQAKHEQAESYFEQIADISDNAGSLGSSKEKLQVDSRKWILARMNRAKYGDRQDIGLGGTDGAPPISTQVEADVSHLSKEEREQLSALARKIVTRGKP